MFLNYDFDITRHEKGDAAVSEAVPSGTPPFIMNAFSQDGCGLCAPFPSDLLAPSRSSRVAELMTNNCPPPQSDRLVLQDMCSDYHNRIQRLNARMKPLLDAYNVLSREHDKFVAHIEDAKAITHPIRSLPADIVYEICMHCIPQWGKDNLRHGPCSSHDSLEGINAPWNISQVCSRWRSVVLSIPTMWSVLVLKLPEYKRMDLNHNLLEYRLSLHLERARHCDLTLLAITDYGREIKFRADHPIMVLLQQSSPRWRHVRIWLTSNVMHSFLSGLKFDRLQHLALHNARLDSDMDMLLLESAPRLSDVRLSGQWPLRLVMPWSQLTVFETVEVGSPFILALLPFLTTAKSVKFACGAESPSIGGGTIRLPKVKKLKVEELGTSALHQGLSTLMAGLETPVLQSLHLIFPRTLTHPQLPLDFPSLHRATALRFIGSFGGCDGPCVQLVALLRKLKMVTSIRMDILRMPNGLLDALVPTGPDAILKALDCLNLSYTGLDREAYEIDPVRVLLVAEARAPGGAPPVDGGARKLVQIRLPRDLTFDSQEHVDRWCAISQRMVITVRGERWVGSAPDMLPQNMSVVKRECDEDVLERTFLHPDDEDEI